METPICLLYILFLLHLLVLTNALKLHSFISSKTLEADPCGDDNPAYGCVYLWRTYSWKIEVCENVSNLSTLEFDKSIIAVKLGPWTKAEIYEGYEYGGNATQFNDPKTFYKLSSDVSCLASSVRVKAQTIHQIQGYIINADTGKIVPKSNFTLNPLSITFINSEKVYNSTIFADNGTYTVTIPEGKYMQKVFTNSFSAEVKLMDVNQDVFQNVSIYPFAGNASPSSGCAWLYYDYVSFIQICEDVPDFRTWGQNENFSITLDKTPLAIKIGPWTEATLYNDYNFKGDEYDFKEYKQFFKLENAFKCGSSSMKIKEIKHYTIKGEIKNADSGSLIPKVNFTLNPITITFNDTERIYTAKIDADTSTYSIEVPEGGIIQRIFTSSFSTEIKILSISEDLSQNTIYIYPFGGKASPDKGCVWLYRNYFNFIEICQDISDLRTWASAGDLIADFDDSAIGVKVGPWTKSTLYTNYSYEGESLYFFDYNKFYRLNEDFKCNGSSIKVQEIRVHTIQGFIRNGDTNSLIPKINFTLNPMSITFNDTEKVYNATINTENSTYSISLPEGNYIQRVFISSFSAMIQIADIYESKNETNELNTIYIYPFGGNSTPESGCVWLYESYFAFIEVCQSESDLRVWGNVGNLAYNFDNAALAIKLGQWTNATLYSDYNYQGNASDYKESNSFYKIDQKFICMTSSIRITAIRMVEIRGYILNGDANTTFPEANFTITPITIKFRNSYGEFIATINTQNSTYGLIIPEGTNVRIPNSASYSSQQKTFYIDVSSYEDNEKNSIYFYGFESFILPNEGCAWLFESLFSFIEVCGEIPDLRVNEFDNVTIALKVGNMTKVILYSGYNYTNVSQTWNNSGFYKLEENLYCQVSSVQLSSTIIARVNVRGYIKNGLTNTVFSSSDLQTYQISVFFIAENKIYNATIFYENSTYSIDLLVGDYIRNSTMINYAQTSTELYILTNSDEISRENTIFMIPISAGWTAILTWGPADDDLDAYVLLPNSEKIYYRKKTSSDGQIKLDVDSRSGGGPETFTFNFKATSFGTYKYYVSSYTKKVPLTESYSKVVIYNGGIKIQDMVVPSESPISNPKYWNVFNLNVDGLVQTFIPSNEFTNTIS